jgi:hypothetical protein
MKLSFTKSNFLGLIMGLTIAMASFGNTDGSFLATPPFRIAYLVLMFSFVIIGLIKQSTWRTQPLNYKSLFFTMIGVGGLTMLLVGVFAR